MSRQPKSLRALLRAPSGVVALIVLAALVVLAIIGPSIWGAQAAKLDLQAARQGSSWAHLLGTDVVGRDVLARTLTATRLSLELAVSAAAIGALLGFPAGAATVLLPPRVQRLADRALHVAVAFPPIIMALFISAVMGPGALGAVLAIGIAIAPQFARIAQTLAAQVAGSDYVAAARVVGIRRWRLVRRYVLPNIAEPLIIQGTAGISVALIAISALSFLGLGVQPPEYDWGRMLADGLDKIFTTPVVALAPAVAITLCGVTFGLLGEALARALNPLLWTADSRRTHRKGTPSSEEIDTAAGSAGAAGSVTMRTGSDPVLSVENLWVRIPTGDTTIAPVAGITFEIGKAEVVGIVGESGSGKSMAALSLARLTPPTAQVTATRLEFAGSDLRRASGRMLRQLLGTRLAMIFQDPMSSLNPVLRVGRQLTEVVEVHKGMSRRSAMQLAEQSLTNVGIPAAKGRLRQYPHEFSGGMRQRAMIAMSMMAEPTLVIADEPTTALDVTVQAQIIDLLRELNARRHTAIVLISHDIAVVTELCTRVLVMYAGRIVEDVDAATLLSAPAHPYTKALLAAVPDLATPLDRELTTIPGRPPTFDDLPAGCPFAPRCETVQERCRVERPRLELTTRGNRVACWVAIGDIGRRPVDASSEERAR